jgi:Lar family restriction alleviation protein
MSDKLKPCPFCGGEADIMTPEDDNMRLAAVMCMGCYVTGPEREAEDLAIAAWNTRCDIPEAELAKVEAERDRQYDQNCEQIKRIAELEAQRDELLEALNLADAALSGANMNMNVVEQKILSAIAKAKESK